MAVPRLASVLEKERSPEVLAAAVTTLGTIATADAIALLERLALGKVRGVVASSPTTRIDACRALLAARSPAAMVALQHVAAEADRKVKSAALQLLAAAPRRGTTAVPAARG
jgi:HEAT repeat protein